jgi:hypothetical protein
MLKSHKKRKNLRYGKQMKKKGRYAPLSKRTKTDRASETPAIE